MPTLTNYLIPLQNVPIQFDIRLAGVDYILTSKYNDMCSSWFLDIADDLGNPIVSGIPLVTGVDLLDGLENLGIGGSLYVVTNGSDSTDIPTLDNLGVDCNLYFQTTSTDE